MLENPFPHFAEAKDAASRFVNAQREYIKLTAELRAKREARSAAFFAGALVFAIVTATLSLFWFTMELHEAGWPAWTLALGSLLVFGSICASLAYVGWKTHKNDHTKSELPITLPRAG